MTQSCYFCGKDMGVKDSNGQEGVFDGLCEECTYKLKLNKRLTELLSAVTDLSTQNWCKVPHQELVFPAIIRQTQSNYGRLT